MRTSGHGERCFAIFSASELRSANGTALAWEGSDSGGGSAVHAWNVSLPRLSFTASESEMEAHAMLVRARRTEGSLGGPLNLFFGPVLGRDTLDVMRWVIAGAEGGPSYADRIALEPSDPSSCYV